jgi:hypothetical protein
MDEYFAAADKWRDLAGYQRRQILRSAGLKNELYEEVLYNTELGDLYRDEINQSRAFLTPDQVKAIIEILR